LLGQAFSYCRPSGLSHAARLHGRQPWYSICFAEQLTAVPVGVTVHVVGKASAELRRFKHRLVKLAA
jgi:hypothetical protein